MLNKIVLALILLLPFIGCTQPQIQADTSTKVITANGEIAGELIKEINFKVKTSDLENFPAGEMTFIELGEANDLLKKIIGKDEVVIKNTTATLIIDYPLNKPFTLKMLSKKGFTRAMLLKTIVDSYKRIYKEEETTATVKTTPADQRPIMNRNQTNGKYGVWGHDLTDLALTGILVYQLPNGEIILNLEIDS